MIRIGILRRTSEIAVLMLSMLPRETATALIARAGHLDDVTLGDLARTLT